MKTLKLAIPAGILAAGFIFCTTASYGTPAFAKKEGNKQCVYCHAKVEAKEGMLKNLNATGQCYKEKKSLATCPVPEKK